jgi:hypothetical protein
MRRWRNIRDRDHIRGAACCLALMGSCYLFVAGVHFAELGRMASDPLGSGKGVGFLISEMVLPFIVLVYGLFSLLWLFCAWGLLRHAKVARDVSIGLFVLTLPCILQVVYFYIDRAALPFAMLGILPSWYGLWVLSTKWDLGERDDSRYISLRL